MFGPFIRQEPSKYKKMQVPLFIAKLVIVGLIIAYQLVKRPLLIFDRSQISKAVGSLRTRSNFILVNIWLENDPDI